MMDGTIDSSMQGGIGIPTLYEMYKRISNIQAAEKYGGKLTLEPCYCKDNYAYDVALTSNGEIVGQLNKTLFRSAGLELSLQ